MGEERTFGMVDESLLRGESVGGNPRQMALPSAAWTRAGVRMGANKRFGIEGSTGTVGKYLRRWRFTLQRPIKLTVKKRPAPVLPRSTY